MITPCSGGLGLPEMVTLQISMAQTQGNIQMHTDAETLEKPFLQDSCTDGEC